MLAAVAILAVASTAFAQINPFGRSSGGRVTKQDLALIESASAKLYKTDTPRVGATERWSNPDSGNAGTVSLTQVYDRDGMPCRKLRHRITLKGTKEPQVYIFSRCRVKSGEWKLL